MIRFFYHFAFLTIVSVQLVAAVNTSLAEDTVAELKEKVSNLKENLDSHPNNQDDSFAVEQEEFDRMRSQLLAAEQEILNKANGIAIDTATTKKSDTAKEQDTDYDVQIEEIKTTKKSVLEDLAKTELNNSQESFPATEAAKAALASSDDEIESIKEQHERAMARLDENAALAKKAVITQRKTERELASAKAKLQTLEKELQEVKNKLIVSQTETERLTNVIGNSSSRAQMNSKTTTPIVFGRQNGDETAKQNAKDRENQSILTVVSDKTYLRTGPSRDNSAIIEVDRGTRLIAQDRQGEWFRVATASGTRAWVQADSVAFGPTRESSPSLTVKIKPAVGEHAIPEEDRAYDLLKEGKKDS